MIHKQGVATLALLHVAPLAGVWIETLSKNDPPCVSRRSRMG
jgi:hypothetical protein